MENYWHLSCGRSWKGVQKPTVSSHNGHPERSPVLNLGGKTTPSVLFCFLATLPHFPFFSCFTSSLFFTSSPYFLSPMPIGFPTSSENSSSLTSSISSCLCCLSESFCSKFNASACDGVLSCCFSPYLSILCFFFSLALLSWPLWVPLLLYSHTFPRLYLFVSLCPTQLPVSTLSPSLSSSLRLYLSPTFCLSIWDSLTLVEVNQAFHLSWLFRFPLWLSISMAPLVPLLLMLVIISSLSAYFVF